MPTKPEGSLTLTALTTAGILAPDASLMQLAHASFLEGPAADVDGTVYFSDLIADRILRLESDHHISVFREGSGRANGNAFDREGRLITCEGAEFGPGGRRRITRTDLASGKITVLTDRFDGRRYNSPNDLTIDLKGRIYFTDPRYGDRSDMELDAEAVYRLDEDGQVHRIISQPIVEKPNGLAVNLDATSLYVIDSNPAVGGNRKVWEFPLDPDGNPGKPRLVFDFGGGRGGDGMGIDREGNLYVCAGIITPRGPGEDTTTSPGVYVMTPTGTLLGVIPIPQDTITNCCFGGPDLRTLYVVAGHAVFRIPVRISGYHVYPEVTRERWRDMEVGGR